MTTAPASATASTSRRVHVRRRDQPPDRLVDDQRGEHEQRHAVGLRREHLDAAQAERQRRRLRGRRGEPHRDQRERDRGGVGEHVRGVGEQRERVRDDAGGDLDRHEQQDQRQRDRQPATVAIRAVGVRVTGPWPCAPCACVACSCGHSLTIRRWRTVVSSAWCRRGRRAAARAGRTTLVSIAAATLLVALKLGVGLATGSLGLISSGIESSGDVIAAVLTFFAVRLGGRPADLEHPYGHRRAENLGALGEAAILLAGGVLVERRGDHAPHSAAPARRRCTGTSSR